MRKGTVVSPRFEEEEYKGQDVVHYGIRIPMQRPVLVTELSRNAQRIIESPKDITFMDMTDQDLPVLRSYWFDENDVTFPTSMEGHIGIVACMPLSGEIVGGIIWTPQGKNLFLHQLISTKWAKTDLQLPTRLIWRSMQKFGMKEWHALDIGVSYNPKRYQFFNNFKIETYPIILKKPFYTPVIRLSPFRSFVDDRIEKNKEREESLEKNNMTFFPRGSYALYGALKHIGVGVGDEVMIVKTFGSDFISGCVTKAIERTGATWTLRGQLHSRTKAVIAIHEFGIPVFQEQDMNILKAAQINKMPIIEDCAWCPTKVWSWSQYAVLSFQKMFNINYGGILDGVKISDEQLWEWGCLDTIKRDKWFWHPADPDGVGKEKRALLWNQYHALVIADGMTPDDCYNYSEAVNNGKWIPTVYLQKFETDQIADDIVARLEDFGIQAGRYWGEPVVYLPIHQNMTSAEVEYMFAVVRGYFNACRDYAKDKTSSK